ncbi:MAG TPA: rhamnulokinase family protein [Anaerolineae bacterium]|nr:rhamnulokinase family protein [Anaerolineae bacterium]
MKHTAKFLAFDLGAESGRAVVGHLDGGKLRLEELYRFSNGPVRVLHSLHWDVLRLWTEIKHGLALAAKSYGGDLASVGLDTWGVDFGLLAADDSLLGNPYHYRDSRTDGMMEAAFEIVPRDEIYRQTGIQFMQLNSLFQLLAMVRADSPVLAAADTFLTMPDLFNFWLSGRKANEFTIATTTQCYNPRTGGWARELLARLDIPSHIFGEIVPPGTVLGSLRAAVAEETGSRRIPVVASAAHDTASAVAAVPATGSDYIYLSSGTWSLMGIESKDPIINQVSLAYNLTNEGGVENTFRFLKNIMGLWLVQECRREWARAGESYSYDDLTAMAAEAPAFGPLVSLSDSRFLPPGDMPGRIQAFCSETGQHVPESRGEIVRCALESLALEYRSVAEGLDEMVGRRLPTLHIFGGGSRNKLLNQFAADATGRTVVAGPVEATAIGNLLVQALALGQIANLAEGRALVRRSFPVETYVPHDTADWDQAYGRYLGLTDP